MSPAIFDQSNESICLFPAALDHHSLEQREATAQSEQMASHARPPHCDRRKEEGQEQCQSESLL